MSIEDQVRDSLRRQAARSEPSTEGWERIVARQRAARGGPHERHTAPRRAMTIAVALALFALAAIPLWAAFGPGSRGSAPTGSGTGTIPTPAPTGGTSHSPSPSPHHTRTTTPTPPPTASRCSADQLSAREIVSDGVAGNVWTPVLLINRSSEACTLSGYPDLRFLGKTGNDLHLHAIHSPDNTGLMTPSPISRAPFTLEPGARSWFIVHFSDVQPPCTRVFSVQITPPGGTGMLTMRVNPIHEWDVCQGGITVTAATPNRPANA